MSLPGGAPARTSRARSRSDLTAALDIGVGSPLPTVFGCDLELLFATGVLRLKSLHYGFWDIRPRVITLASIREAQARFTAELIKFVPADAKTVLDVGAGIGDNARALARLGLQVTAISPDRNHARYFKRLEGVQYLRTKFEHFDLPAQFDVVFMCESLNYFDREIGLQQCRRYVAPGGHLLIAAMFQGDQQEPFSSFFRPADLPFVELARRYGFSLHSGRDVTENVLPTMEYAHRALQRFVFPLARGAAPNTWCGRLVRKTPIRRTAEAIDDVRAFYERRTEPEYYRTHIRYLFLLFSRTSSGS